MEQCALLHVEDDDASAFLFRLALDEAEIPASVYRVSDGEQALDFLRKTGRYQKARTPALLVLDLNLPKLDGWAILAERQKSRDLQAIPVLVLSTASAQQNQTRAFALGVQHYLEKPFDFDLLVQQARTYCGPFLGSALPLEASVGTSAESLPRMEAAMGQQERCGVAQVGDG
jgi:CheY-like chemotaxis protein